MAKRPTPSPLLLTRTSMETIEQLLDGVPNEMVELSPHLLQYPSGHWHILLRDAREEGAMADITTSTGHHTLIFRAVLVILLVAIEKLESLNMDGSTQHKYRTYLMLDERNGLIKIGKFSSPECREKTLQSEQPRTRLLAVCQDDIESALHKELAKFRVRGEWFSLEQGQIDSIIQQHEFKAKR